MAEIAPASVGPRVVSRERRTKARRSVMGLNLVTVDMDPAGFGLMLDVSEEGLGVQVMTKIEPGTAVKVVFDVPDTPGRIEGTGLVTWYDGEGRVGVRLQQLNGDSASELKKWIESLPESSIIPEPVNAPPRSEVNLREQVRAIQAQIATSDLDIDTVLQFLVEKVVDLTKATGGAVALEANQEMVCRASTGLAPEVGVSIGAGSALTSECIRTAKIVHCVDTEKDSRVDRDICRQLNLRSSLILPILVEGKVKGVLELFSSLPKAFGEQHLSLLQQLADFTSQLVSESGTESKVQPVKTVPKADQAVSTQPPVSQSLQKAVVAIPTISGPLAKTGTNQAATVVALDKVEKRSRAAEAPIAVIDELPSATEPAPKRNRLTMPVLIVVILIALASAGLWFRARVKVPAASIQGANPAATVQPTLAPAQPVPVTVPTTSSEITGAKPVTQNLPAVTTPASEKTRETVTPAMTVAASKSSLKPVETPIEAPSVSNTASASLGNINLPGAVSTPQLASSGNVLGGTLIRRVEPEYPAFGRKLRLQGDVVLVARVTKKGTVENVRKVSGSPTLVPAAIDAVRQWKYEPYTLNGEPQDVEVNITVHFRLPK